MDEEPKKSKEELKLEKIHQARKEEQTLLDSWKQSKDWIDVIESKCYFEMIHYIKMVSQGLSKCTIIDGAGGLGKSYSTITILNQEKSDYAYTDSYSTAPAFYIWLYKNKEKIIVLDDVTGILNDKRSQAYLKSATWEVNGKRIIHNMSMKPLEDEEGRIVPDHFEFNGAIILLTNKINKKNAHIEAILTRANYAEIIIDYNEKLKILEQISKKKWGTLTDKERNEIFIFLKEEASQAVSSLNLRTLIHLYQFYEYSKKNKIRDLWKRLGMNLLKKDDLLLMVMELEKDEKLPSVEDKIKKFKELSGMSRATYFRLKEQLDKKSQVSQEEENG